MSGGKHFLQFKDFSREEFDYLFERTRRIKEKFKSYQRYWPLADRTLVMIFEKASTRTRLSFEAGIQQLGGAAIYLNTRDSQLGRGEPVEDSAQVISRMCDLIMIRTFEQSIVERLAAHSRVPVINGLTNEYHPCQIMADIYTFIEQRGLEAGILINVTAEKVVRLLPALNFSAEEGQELVARLVPLIRNFLSA